MRRGDRAGSVLIEVVIALVLLALWGTALVTLLGQTSRTMEQVARTERETRDAAARLDALAALDRAALLDRLGRSTATGWSLEIDLVGPGLFDVAIAPSDTSAALLHTTLYRPDTSDDPAR